LSKLDEHINLESGENLAEFIMSWWLFKTNKGFWLSNDVTFIRLSSAPDNINLLSYEISTDLIGASWRRRVCEVPSLIWLVKVKYKFKIVYHKLTKTNFEFNQTLTVSSEEPDKIISPFADIATSLTDPLCPINLYGFSWGLKFHTIKFPSALEVTTCFLKI